MREKNYQRVKPGEPTYKFIQKAKQNGIWVCDSVDHDEPDGCSNPDCFKNSHQNYSSWTPPNKSQTTTRPVKDPRCIDDMSVDEIREMLTNALQSGRDVEIELRIPTGPKPRRQARQKKS